MEAFVAGMTQYLTHSCPVSSVIVFTFSRLAQVP